MLGERRDTRFRSELFNPENRLGSASLDGPSVLALNLVESTGEKVDGRIVRVERAPNPDLSGPGDKGRPEESDTIGLAEVQVFCTFDRAR